MSFTGLPFSVSFGVTGAFTLLMYLHSREISRERKERFDRFLQTDAIITKALENYSNDLRLLRKGMNSPAPKGNGNGAI